MTDYGTDISTFPFDMSFTIISGPRVIAEHVARWWLDRRGGDLMSYLNAPIKDSTLSIIKGKLEASALLEEGVVSCSVSVDSDGRSIVSRGVITLADGVKLSLVLTIPEVTLETIYP